MTDVKGNAAWFRFVCGHIIFDSTSEWAKAFIITHYITDCHNKPLYESLCCDADIRDRATVRNYENHQR